MDATQNDTEGKASHEEIASKESGVTAEPEDAEKAVAVKSGE